jgi:hypothetical protein
MYSDILSGILSDSSSGILSDSSSGILSGIYICCHIHSDTIVALTIFHIVSDILSDILSVIYCDILSGCLALFQTFYLTFCLTCILTFYLMFCLPYPTLLCLATRLFCNTKPGRKAWFEKKRKDRR